MRGTSIFPPCRFSANNSDDNLLLQLSILEASRYNTPSYVGVIHLNYHQVSTLSSQGRERARMNMLRLGRLWNEAGQKIPGTNLTVDEVGRICEGAIESIIPLNVKAVVAGVDDKPDLVLGSFNRAFDIKATYKRSAATFSLAQRAVGKYSHLIYAQFDEEKSEVHIWASKLVISEWELRPGTSGKPDFYLLKCPPVRKDILH